MYADTVCINCTAAFSFRSYHGIGMKMIMIQFFCYLLCFHPVFSHVNHYIHGIFEVIIKKKKENHYFDLYFLPKHIPPFSRGFDSQCFALAHRLMYVFMCAVYWFVYFSLSQYSISCRRARNENGITVLKNNVISARFHIIYDVIQYYKFIWKSIIDRARRYFFLVFFNNA